MSFFKCKMCGGTIEFEPGSSIGTCDSCGTMQTLPRLDSDRKSNLYDRANHFRRNNDFDKATSIYEQILNEDNTDAEAYWSLVLCRYGIEYVEDPTSHRRIPTVNRAQFTSIFADEDYKSALQYADSYQKSIYEGEAKAIDEIQRGILAISQKEDPFDVFICYKETDASGRRTQDSVLANDLYHQLTQEGFKVFFSRITLEDKLGTAYEPYIFAALNSAKAMVVLGTKPEYFNAVWVKNEWSRYLALIKNGAKKTLIPAYRDMDPYDLPEEFSHLQAQDMSKLGFMQDLIRGIKKILEIDTPKTVVHGPKDTIAVGGVSNVNTSLLLRRAFLFLEDENWKEADDYCEKVLDQEPDNVTAYLYKLMSHLHVSREEQLAYCQAPFDSGVLYKRLEKIGDKNLISQLQQYNETIRERLRAEKYDSAVKLTSGSSLSDNENAIAKFRSLAGYRDADEQLKKCFERDFQYTPDIIYHGESLNGKPNGTGHMVYKNGTTYHGEFKNGKYHGRGVLHYNDGTSYEGSFVNGSYEGYGKLTYANQDTWEGIFHDNQQYTGSGIWHYTDNSFNSTWREGKRNGKTSIRWKSGETWEGEYRDDQPYNGSGIIEYSDAVFTGTYVNGKRDGSFRLDWIMGGSFVGEYVNGSANGSGVWYFSNGKYEGEMVNGVLEGKGVWAPNSGGVFTGTFHDNNAWTGRWANGTFYRNGHEASSGSRIFAGLVLLLMGVGFAAGAITCVGYAYEIGFWILGIFCSFNACFFLGLGIGVLRRRIDCGASAGTGALVALVTGLINIISCIASC